MIQNQRFNGYRYRTHIICHIGVQWEGCSVTTLNQINDSKVILDRLNQIERLILDGVGSPWLQTKEAAAYLRCSLSKFEDLSQRGRFPYCRLDVSAPKSRRLYHRKHLAAYLLTGKNARVDRLGNREKKMVEELA